MACDLFQVRKNCLWNSEWIQPEEPCSGHWPGLSGSPDIRHSSKITYPPCNSTSHIRTPVCER